MPGVACVLVAEDLPQPMPRFGPAFADRPILATGETKFFGEPVAAVVAETKDAAEAAAALVQIEAEPLPAVLSVEQALDPVVGARAGSRHFARAIRSRSTNILREWTFGWGNPARRSPISVIEHEYRFPMVTHFAIEPHVFIAAPDGNGVDDLDADATSVRPAARRRRRAEVADRESAHRRAGSGRRFRRQGMAEVRTAARGPGAAPWPCRCAWCSRSKKHSRPARRTSARIQREDAASIATGGIVSQELHTDFLIGAYADIGVRVVSKASYAACGPYRTPNAKVTARALLSHTTPSTAFRGFGTPQASWAVECQLTEAARHSGNRPGRDSAAQSAAQGRGVHSRTTRRLTATGRLHSRRPSVRSTGTRRWQRTAAAVSRSGLKSSSTASASLAIVRLHYDGSVSVFSGTSDMGQGARTVLAQIAGQGAGRRARTASSITHGRHVDRSLRLLHVGEPLDGVHGQRRHQGVRADPAPASGVCRPRARR